jgi:hypothetical protein
MAKSNSRTAKRFGRRRNGIAGRQKVLADGEIELPDGKTLSPMAETNFQAARLFRLRG